MNSRNKKAIWKIENLLNQFYYKYSLEEMEKGEDLCFKGFVKISDDLSQGWPRLISLGESEEPYDPRICDLPFKDEEGAYGL